jgi:hypothetical protein
MESLPPSECTTLLRSRVPTVLGGENYATDPTYPAEVALGVDVRHPRHLGVDKEFTFAIYDIAGMLPTPTNWCSKPHNPK